MNETKHKESEALLLEDVTAILEGIPDRQSKEKVSLEEIEGAREQMIGCGLDPDVARMAFHVREQAGQGSAEEPMHAMELVHLICRLLNPPTSEDVLSIRRDLSA